MEIRHKKLASARAKILWNYYNETGCLVNSDIPRLFGTDRAQTTAIIKTLSERHNLKLPPILTVAKKNAMDRAAVLHNKYNENGGRLTMAECRELFPVSYIAQMLSGIENKGIELPPIIGRQKRNKEFHMPPRRNVSSEYPAGLNALDKVRKLPGGQVAYTLR